MRRYLSRVVLLASITALLSLLFAGLSYAGSYGSGFYNAGEYCGPPDNCGITLSTSVTVSVNVTPSGGSTTCSDQSDSVGVTTDSGAGYTLTLGDSDTNTNLVGGSHGGTIAATSGTLASPTALGANQWGYRVPNLGTFGAGPSSAQTNLTSLGLTFAGVESSSNTADTLANTNVPADPTVTTPVWYGVCANTSTVTDTYSDIVTYTATTN